MRTAGDDVFSNFTHKPFHDTLHKRFEQLQEALGKVKAGLRPANHPHILSSLRRDVRAQSVQLLGGRLPWPFKSYSYRDLTAVGSN